MHNYIQWRAIYISLTATGENAGSRYSLQVSPRLKLFASHISMRHENVLVPVRQVRKREALLTLSIPWDVERNVAQYNPRVTGSKAAS